MFPDRGFFSQTDAFPIIPETLVDHHKMTMVVCYVFLAIGNIEVVSFIGVRFCGFTLWNISYKRLWLGYKTYRITTKLCITTYSRNSLPPVFFVLLQALSILSRVHCFLPYQHFYFPATLGVKKVLQSSKNSTSIFLWFSIVYHSHILKMCCRKNVCVCLSVCLSVRRRT